MNYLRSKSRDWKHQKDILKKKIQNSNKKSPPLSRKICQLGKQNNKVVYIVYSLTTHHHYIEGFKEIDDYAGFFTSRDDAEKVAECLNNIFLNVKDPVDKYRIIDKYRVSTIHTEDTHKTLYRVRALYKLITFIPPEKQEYIMGITESFQEARKLQYNSGYHNKIKRYYLNDVMPTMNISDYDIDLHKENMKIITHELQKYPQKQKIKQALEELKYAPPSNLLPKGGIKYQEMINDPDFKKRWSKYDKKFQD